MADIPAAELHAVGDVGHRRSRARVMVDLSNEGPRAYETISGGIHQLNITESTKNNYRLRMNAMTRWIRDTTRMNTNGTVY